MEHPFFPTATTRAEALRWLTIAEKLLSARDLRGSKSFAIRARDSDPSLTPADQIIAIADTLLAGDRRIGNNLHDWYAILRVPLQQCRDTDLIVNQYRSLTFLLNPQRNRFPFAEQAFRLVQDALSALSNPSEKSMYDKELAFYLQPQQQQADPFSNTVPVMHQNFMFFGASDSNGLAPAPAPAPHPAPQPQVAAVHFSQPQVLASPQPQHDTMSVRSTRESQNFMSFNSGTNIVFGSASSSTLTPEPSNKQTTGNYSSFSDNAAETPGPTPEQMNGDNQKNDQRQNYSHIDDKTSNDENLSENVGEKAESREVGETVDAEHDGVDPPDIGDGSTMWTACPYCFYMYEYPTIYADCTLRCQNCKKAFQAVVIPSPPPVGGGREDYFCCWGLLPMGFSMEIFEKGRSSTSIWTPFSPMFMCPQPVNSSNSTANEAARKSSAPRVYIDDDDVLVEVSDLSEPDNVEWRKDTGKRKKAKNVKGNAVSGGMPSKSADKEQADNGLPSQNAGETASEVANNTSKKRAAVNARKQPRRVVKNFGKLDLNVEFSNDPEESAPKTNRDDRPVRGDDGNIEGIGFFEGLEEFLSSLPILNVVGAEKVVKAA